MFEIENTKLKDELFDEKKFHSQTLLDIKKRYDMALRNSDEQCESIKRQRDIELEKMSKFYSTSKIDNDTIIKLKSHLEAKLDYNQE